MTSQRILTQPMRAPQPAVKTGMQASVKPASALGSNATTMYLQRTAGNQQTRAALAYDGKATQVAAGAANDSEVATTRPQPKLPPLSPEVRAQMTADIDYIVRILKKGTPDSGDQTQLLEAVRVNARRDEDLSPTERAGRCTPMLDHFLLLLKSRAFSRSSFRSLWQDQYSIVYDTLWYEFRGFWLEEFKRVVKQSELERTKGPEAKDTENGVALLAKQEAMGMWGMLKGMGTGLASIAGPEAAQYIAAQFDESAHIMFGHEWDASEQLVWGMNAGQIGTAGGDVIIQLTMFARTLGAKGGKVLQLLNNLDRFKRAHQVLAALGGLQGSLMALKGIGEVINAKRKAHEEITLNSLIHDPRFLDQIVVLVSSGINVALALKGAPPTAQQGFTRARIAVLLGTLQLSAAVTDLANIAQSDMGDLEKELEYGRVMSGVIPQLVGLVVAGHGQVQSSQQAAQERQAQQAGRRQGKTPPTPDPQLAAEPPTPDAEVATQGKTMRGTAEPKTPKTVSTHEAIEQTRKPIADAHEAAMLDEVKKRLAPRDAQPLVADVATGQRPSAYKAPTKGSATVGKPNKSLAAAREVYDRVITETGGDHEVGIWQHPDTGEYVVRLGQPTAVDPPQEGTTWRAVQHFHTNKSDVPLWRMPAGADVSELAGRVSGQARTMTEIVEYPLPNGKRGRAAYTVTVEGKLTIEFIGSDGQRVSKTIDKVEDYASYHPSRKVIADQSIRDEVEEWLDAARGNAVANNPAAGGKTMRAAAPSKPAVPAPSLVDLARAQAAKERALATAEWAQSKKATQGKAQAQAAAAKTPAAGDKSFKDLVAELARPAEVPAAGKAAPPAPNLELKPPTTEQQVAVRFRADAKTKGHFIPGPELPPGQDPFAVDRSAYLKSASKEFKAAAANPEFVVLPESQARAMGFVEQGKPFKSTDENQAFQARTQEPDPVAPVFTPYQRDGVQMESSKAGPGSHPIAGRTSPKQTPAESEGAWIRTVAPSLEENESYKFQLVKKKERGLKRAGNASERGADHITADMSSDPPRIYLNDATTPDQIKNKKRSHKDWYQQFKDDFPPNASGVRDFGFGPEINAKLNAAVDAGEVYTRTLRPSEPAAGSLAKHKVIDLTGEPMQEYVSDEAVKIGRKKPTKS